MRPIGAPAMLLLASLVGCGGADPPAPPTDEDTPTAEWFVDVSDEVGLDFVHESGVTGDFHSPEIMGAGAALLDYDGDGDLDVYLTNGNRTVPTGARADEPTNRLYRREADGSLVDATRESGLGDGGYGMGVAVGDVDNDGDVDVYVSNFGEDRFYRNRGDGTFEDATASAHVAVGGWSTSAAFLDYDRDGFLDLYVARYVEFDPEKPCFDQAGRPDYCSPRVYPPMRDVLLHNEGDGTFADVTDRSGIGSVAAAGLGVVSDDFDDDGWLDIYVANDAYANQLWTNRGDGTFEDRALLMGAAYNLNGEAEAGMGVVSADVDNDGDSDLFMTHLNKESNTFLRNLGGSSGFTDVTGESGLGPSSMPYTGFGTVAFDVEEDGDLDLLVANGRVFRGDPQPGNLLPPPWDVYSEPNLFYLNDGTGRFTRARKQVASLCDTVEITRGIAIGDIDDDGDLDLLLNNIHGRARLYRNEAPRLGHWLQVRAYDPRWNRDAIGARVTVVAGPLRRVRTIASEFSYLSSSRPIAHFGLGPASEVERIEVRWPDGARETFPGTPADRTVVLARGEGRSGS